MLDDVHLGNAGAGVMPKRTECVICIAEEDMENGCVDGVIRGHLRTILKENDYEGDST